MSKQARTEAFDLVYKNSVWGNGSGHGSAPEYTAQYRVFLEHYMLHHGIRSVLDVGCGDWQSTKLIDWSGIDYTGADVASTVVEANSKAYAKPGIRFLHLDAVTEALPAADLVIVKDCLQHLSIASAKAVLEKLRPFKRALVTQDAEFHYRLNQDCEDGGYRAMDIRKPPFNIPAEKLFAFGTFEGKIVLELRT